MNGIIALLILFSSTIQALVPTYEELQFNLEQKTIVYTHNSVLLKKLKGQIDREGDKEIRNTLLNVYLKQNHELAVTKEQIGVIEADIRKYYPEAETP